MYTRRLPLRRRGGAVFVETAFVFSLTLLILIGMVVGGIGIFRFQQVAALAREGARYASVRGGQYASETGQAAATQTSIHNYIKSISVGLDPAQLQQTTVTWNTSNMPSRSDANGNAIGNTVKVTVTYKWTPGVVLTWLGTITLTSTSEIPMSY